MWFDGLLTDFFNRPLTSSFSNTTLKTGHVTQKRFRFSSTATGLTDSERLLIDSIKRRAPKKKAIVNVETEGLSETPVVALSTAEEYNLEAIQSAAIQQGLYQPVDHEIDDFDGEILHFTAKYKFNEKKREFFIFRYGMALLFAFIRNTHQ